MWNLLHEKNHSCTAWKNYLNVINSTHKILKLYFRKFIYKKNNKICKYLRLSYVKKNNHIFSNNLWKIYFIVKYYNIITTESVNSKP